MGKERISISPDQLIAMDIQSFYFPWLAADFADGAPFG
jgi:hypothetical protein